MPGAFALFKALAMGYILVEELSNIPSVKMTGKDSQENTGFPELEVKIEVYMLIKSVMECMSVQVRAWKYHQFGLCPK